MAFSDALILPVRAAAFRLQLKFYDTSNALITTWAGMDSQISKDGGNFAACTNEATEIQTSGTGYLDLTASETTCDSFWIKTTITNSNSVPFVMAFATQRTGAYVMVNVVELLGTAWLTPGTAGTPDVNAKLISGSGTAADNVELAGLAYSVTRGLSGTALPAAAAEAAGGLYTRGTGAGQIAQSNNGQINVDAVRISGDATAADNLELFFDGTGYNAANSTIGHVTSFAGGFGAFAIQVTVTDGSIPLQNATITVNDGVTPYTQITDVSGHASYSLAAGTYTVTIVKALYTFTPTTRTVTGNQAGTLVNNLVMAQTNPPPIPPVDPAKGTVYGSVVRSDAQSPAGIGITATLRNVQGQTIAYTVGNMLVPVVQETTAAVDGSWTMDLFGNADITPAGSYWQIAIPMANFSANVTVVSGQSVDVNALIT